MGESLSGASKQFNQCSSISPMADAIFQSLQSVANNNSTNASNNSSYTMSPFVYFYPPTGNMTNANSLTQFTHPNIALQTITSMNPHQSNEAHNPATTTIYNGNSHHQVSNSSNQVKSTHTNNNNNNGGDSNSAPSLFPTNQLNFNIDNNTPSSFLMPNNVTQHPQHHNQVLQNTFPTFMFNNQLNNSALNGAVTNLILNPNQAMVNTKNSQIDIQNTKCGKVSESSTFNASQNVFNVENVSTELKEENNSPSDSKVDCPSNSSTKESNSGQFECTECGRRFRMKCRLKAHSRRHTGERPFTCDLCHRGFAERGNLHRHRQTHTKERKFTCNSCGNTFRQSSGLSNHRRFHCSGSAGRLCHYCGRYFKSSSSLNMHVRWKHLRNTDKFSNRKEKVASHSKTTVNNRNCHSTLLRVKCSSFKTSKSKMSSLRSKKFLPTTSHNDPAEETTVSNDNPQTTASHNTKINETLHFQCTICSRTFLFQCRLAAHMRCHTNVRPYRCSQCDRSFTQRGYLMRHSAVHSTERPFSCTECDRSYKHYGSLVNHRRTHRLISNQQQLMTSSSSAMLLAGEKVSDGKSSSNLSPLISLDNGANNTEPLSYSSFLSDSIEQEDESSHTLHLLQPPTSLMDNIDQSEFLDLSSSLTSHSESI